jgi:prepilin-type processing-associated H-X9-DG protein
MYYDQNHLFPWGHQDNQTDDMDNTKEMLPWATSILDFLGEINLQKRFNEDLPFNYPINNPATTPSAATTPLKVYQCPSSPSDGKPYTDTWTALPQNYGPISGPQSWTVSASDYIATSGVVGSLSNLIWPMGYNGDTNGVLQDNFQVSIPMITDGTSNMVIVGESGGAPDVWLNGKVFDSPPFNKTMQAVVISGNGWADSFNGENWLQGVDPAGNVPGLCTINCVNVQAFYSFHPNVANFLFVDGSARSFSANTDAKIVMELITIRGGKNSDDPF